MRIASVAAAIALWQVLTANDVRLWLRFDTLPTVTEIVAAFGTPDRHAGLLAGPRPVADPHPHRLRARGGGGRRHRHPARPLAEVRQRLRPAHRTGPAHPRDRDRARRDPAVPHRRGRASSSSRSSPPTSRSWSAPATPSARCRRCGRTRCARSAATAWDVHHPSRVARHPSRRVRRPVGRHRRRVDLRDLRRDDLRAARRRLPHLAGVHRAGLPGGVRRHHHHRRARLRHLGRRRTDRPPRHPLAAPRRGERRDERRHDP